MKMSSATGAKPMSKLAIGMAVTDVTVVSMRYLTFTLQNRPIDFNQTLSIGLRSSHHIYGPGFRGVEHLARR